MKLFISWSGYRSKLLAEALRAWLPRVINAAEPWLSATDAQKGSRWAWELAAALKDSAVGVICVTTENLREPWILFEAGAISKSVEDTLVCPYLLDVDPPALPAPLGQFLTTRANKQDTRALVAAINTRLADARLQPGQLDKAFEKCWPDLERKIHEITQERSERFSEKSLLDDLLQCMDDGGNPHPWKQFAERTITNRWVRLNVSYFCGAVRCEPGDHPGIVPVGSRLRLEYRVRSSLDLPVQVWLGVNLGGGGPPLFTPEEDIQEQMEPGERVLSRDLTIQSDWPAGEYEVHAEIWYGRRSNINRSIVLAELWRRPLRVRLKARGVRQRTQSRNR
jgi:TIR domain